MNDLFKQTLLYDFYGELLTPHQKDIYEQYVLEDYSLSEIAANQQVSRQAVHDIVKRCQKILEEYEEKLKLVEKFLKIREQVQEIDAALEQGESGDLSTQVMHEKIHQIAATIIEEL